MASLIAAVFAVGGAAALAYAIYLSSGFIKPEPRSPDRSF
jgi:hypothetical protein